MFETLWASHYAQKLTAHELNQFRRAETRGPSLLLTDVIKREFYDKAADRYMAVSDNKEVAGRSHFLCVDLKNGRADWEQQCLFTNALRISYPNEDEFNHPSHRVKISPHHILTLEFDSKSLAFFQQQLSWFRSARHPLDSPIGKLVRHLRTEFADFVGLNVTYSGNKSFHYHFVVETSLVSGSVPKPTSARLGFQKAWDRLHDEFVNFPDLALPSHERPDQSLRQPEQYRRLPNGMRLNDKADHLFGVPEDEVLPQVVMWEHLKLDRQCGGTASLLAPADFSLASSAPLRARGTGGAAVLPSIQAGEEAFCAIKLEAIFDGVNDWPKFAGFDRSHGDLRAQFLNSPGDKTPSSIMRSDFSTVMIQGSNPLGLTNDEHGGGTLMPRLPRPLGEMMDLWAAEYQQRHIAPGGRVRTPMEQEFAEAATDKAAAFDALGTVIDGLISARITRPEVHLLAAPEGIRKTRTILSNIPRYHRLLRGNGLPAWIMLASPTYDGAAEKAEEFRQVQKADGTTNFTPVVLPSFSAIYEDELGGRGPDFITHVEAARLGFSSRIEAISARQPTIMERIRRRYADLRASFDQTSPIFFTVHQVAQSWGSGADSRLLLSPPMWDTSLDRSSRRQRAMEETRLGLLIHDEIHAEGVVEAEPAERVAQVLTMVRDSGWTSKTSNAAKFQIHKEFMDKQPHAEFLPFEDACRIADVAETEWDVCLSRPCGEYGSRSNGWEDIYDQAEDRHWCLRARNWANLAAHRTLILTTEAVPVAVAERAGLWRITNLDTPLIQKDRVDVIPLRSLRSSTTAEHVEQHQIAAMASGRHLHAVGNKLARLENTLSHIAAKGSNALIGKDIIQTMTPMTPENYAYFQALNAWTGRTDLARLRHIDEFNQTAGRNLGFRAPVSGPKPSHTLLINRRLFDNLVPLLSHARYEMADVSAQQSRKNVRRRAKRAKEPAVAITSRDKLKLLRAALAA